MIASDVCEKQWIKETIDVIAGAGRVGKNEVGEKKMILGRNIFLPLLFLSFRHSSS
jgi:hypothetical protein